jgi:hypothetical protein
MNLVPGERAVLGMIRTLVAQSKSRTHRVTVLRSQWPPMHADVYDAGYVGLIAKRLIQVSPDRQTFSVTSSGLALLGLQDAPA